LRRCPLPGVVERIAARELAADAGLVAPDFLFRRGVPREADYPEFREVLRQAPLPSVRGEPFVRLRRGLASRRRAPVRPGGGHSGAASEAKPRIRSGGNPESRGSPPDWIPAFAGMTRDRWGFVFERTAGEPWTFARYRVPRMVEAEVWRRREVALPSCQGPAPDTSRGHRHGCRSEQHPQARGLRYRRNRARIETPVRPAEADLQPYRSSSRGNALVRMLPVQGVTIVE
jgi:hypothetical protein